MRVCHKCGNKTKNNELKLVKIRILNADCQYEFDQIYDLCIKCKDKLLDAVSEVISNCDSYQVESTAIRMILKKGKPNKDKKKTTTKKRSKVKDIVEGV